MGFTILGDIADVETFAVGRRIREIGRLRKRYGPGRWRKRKGQARIRLADGSTRQAEQHGKHNLGGRFAAGAFSLTDS